MDKRLIAASFSRAATTYDKVAHLQRDVGDLLFSQCPWPDVLVERRVCVDLGCGTGFFIPRIQSQTAAEKVIGVDLAEGMVTYAQQHHPEAEFLVADMEFMPLADASCDFVFSSLAVQWSEDLPQVLAECFRILRPGGLLMFSTLLDGTLYELAESWAAADHYQHVNRFMPRQMLEEVVSRSTFAQSDIKTNQTVLQYSGIRELTHELKALGAHNVNQNRSQGMTGKAAIRHFKEAYERFRKDDFLPATYEVASVYLRKAL